MAVDENPRPYLGDAAVRAYQEGGAGDAEEFAPVQRFLLPHPIGLEHAVLLVGAERDAELVLGLELVLGRDRVGGDADDRGSGPGEVAAQAREVDRLAGATGGIRPRIEIEHELLPGEVGKRHRAAAVARQAEGRRLAAGSGQFH